MKISEAIPEVFKQTYPILEPGTQLLLAVSLLRFHQIDALPIGLKPRQKKRLAVFGYSFLSSLLKTERHEYTKLLESPCEVASLELASIGDGRSVRSLLEVFHRTKFGFVWVESSKLGGFASIRDVLGLYKSGIIETDLTVEQVASPIFSMPKKSRIRDVIEEMFSHGFRRMFITGEKSIVTDRKIISHIFSASQLHATITNPGVMFDLTLEDVQAMTPKRISSHLSIKDAAMVMKETLEDCLICEKGIITPWDLIMKPFIKGELKFAK